MGDARPNQRGDCAREKPQRIQLVSAFLAARTNRDFHTRPCGKTVRNIKAPLSVETKRGLKLIFLLIHFSDYLCSNLCIDRCYFRFHTRSNAPDKMCTVFLSIPSSQHDLLSDIFSLYTRIINDSLCISACMCVNCVNSFITFRQEPVYA